MSLIRVELPSEHSAPMIYYLTKAQLIKFRSSVIKGKSAPLNSMINGHYFQFNQDSIYHYDFAEFTGSYLVIPTINILKKLNTYIDNN
ncbi:MAG: hypothetical protein ACI9YH_002417 [Colwellia sp.]|jgi:hypothetical protein